MKSITKTLVTAAILAAPLASLAAPSFVRLGRRPLQVHRVPASPNRRFASTLGAPTSTSVVNGETHYVYNYVDTWGMKSVFDVSFDSSGRVAGKSQLRLAY